MPAGPPIETATKVKVTSEDRVSRLPTEENIDCGEHGADSHGFIRELAVRILISRLGSETRVGLAHKQEVRGTRASFLGIASHIR